MDGSGIIPVVFGGTAPKPKPLHLEVIRIIRGRLTGTPAKIDNGLNFTCNDVRLSAGGCVAVIVDPHDGQEYELELRPKQAEPARAAA